MLSLCTTQCLLSTGKLEAGGSLTGLKLLTRNNTQYAIHTTLHHHQKDKGTILQIKKKKIVY